MKSTIIIFLLVALLACKRDTTLPVSERLKKVWIAGVVKEANTIVFTKGAVTNTKPGYSQFQLDLSSSTVSLREFDGNTFVGSWELSADEKTLTLKGLSPQPSGTGGIIAYNIASLTDTDLVLTAKTTSLKTGGTLNTYNLIR